MPAVLEIAAENSYYSALRGCVAGKVEGFTRQTGVNESSEIPPAAQAANEIPIMITRKSSAVWQGTLKEGSGDLELGSGAFKGQYSFKSRFENGTGTNPEELIGAAEAGCYSMALSANLEKAGFPPQRISTTAKVNLDKGDAGFSVVSIELETEAQVAGIDDAKFQEQAELTKKTCPISKALAGTEIKLKAVLKK